MLLTKLSGCAQKMGSKRKALHLYSAIRVLARSSSRTTWNKDWMPGPFPRTEEERIAAAKKYNLIPEDYKPFPEDEGYGDYPDIEPVSAAGRNQFEPFEFPHVKRNYGEPVHAEFDMYIEDRINVEHKFKPSVWRQFFYLSSGITLYVCLFFIGDAFKYNYPIVPKQYPYQGQKHYTFEPDTS